MSSFRSLNEVPSKYRSIFSSIDHFNHVQSEVFDDVLNTKKHIVVSAPTGSGKTKIFELAIVELLMSLKQNKQTHCEPENVKIIYVAPTKALCNEIFELWQKKFMAFGLKVALATGDSDPTEMADLNDLSAYQIVVTTPEKWDAMTRKWKDHCEIANTVRLMLIDEVHLIGDTFRGPTLEAIVSRIKSFPLSRQIRFISVSASLPNIEDISRWLSAQQDADSVRMFQIAEASSPVHLQRRVIGYPYVGNSFQFSMKLTYELSNLVKRILFQLTGDKQILIFCQSRNDVESSLNRLLNDIQLNLDEARLTALKCISQSIQDERLQKAIVAGFAFHHAGLAIDDRECVEKAYRDGFIKILLSTNTLAMGVNLPAHTVIIKSTERFIKGETKEIPESILLQMMGRAGRQQYNTTGLIYIMTKQERAKYYEQFVTGSAQIESHLNNKLAEFLNAEIVLKTITDTEASVKQWFRTTFLYARTLKTMTEIQADSKLKDCCRCAIQRLQSSGLIECKADGGLLPLPYGAIMAKNFLSIATMVAFQGFFGNETIADILDKIAYCNEFSEFYLRQNQKKILNDINNGTTGKRIRYPIPSKITTVPQKVSCLLQAVLSHVPIESGALQMETQKMVQIAKRMVSSLIDFFQSEQFKRNCCNSIHSATILAKSLKTRAWNDLFFYQVLNLSEADVNKLLRLGINAVDVLLKTNPREIEDILNKDIPFGNELIDDVATKCPCYEVNIDVMAGHVILVRVVQSNIRYEYKSSPNDALILLVGDSCNRLLIYENIQLTMNENGFYEKLLSYTPSAHAGFAHVIHESLAGADKMVQFRTTAAFGEADSTASEDQRSVSTKSLKKNSPPKKADAQKNCNTLQVSTTKSIKSVNSHGSNDGASMKSKSSNQTRLSQFYSKIGKPQTILEKPSMKSVFDSKNKIEPIKNIVYSPDLFATPTQVTPKPVLLYDFNYLQSNTSQTSNGCSVSIANGQENSKENDSPNVTVAVKSPALAHTPIRHKINEQLEAQNATNGFVRANVIFHKDIADVIPESSKDLLMSKDASLANVGETLCELDDDFIDLIYEELDDLESLHPAKNCTITGLGNSVFLKSSKNSDNHTLKDLNLNFNNRKSETIIKDFDDSSDFRDRNLIGLDGHSISTNYDSFFAIDDPDVLDKDTEVHEISVNKEVTKVLLGNDVAPQATLMDSALAAPKGMSEDNIHQNQAKEHQTVSVAQSQASKYSNRAVWGSQVQEPSPPKVRNRQSAPKRVLLDNFGFVAPHQMQPSQNTLQQALQRSSFLMPDSPEQKRTKLSIDDLLANKRKGNKYEEQLNRLTSLSDARQPHKKMVEKLVLKNVFARVSQSNMKSSEKVKEDTTLRIKQYQERLKTDPNYKQCDYDRDYIRSKILKLTPDRKTTNQSNDESLFMFDDIDSVSELGNASNKDSFFSDNFSMMNFATQDSGSTFFEQ